MLAVPSVTSRVQSCRLAPSLARVDLASSLGEAAGVPTPVMDGLVADASAMLGEDARAEGPTLATLGLDGLDVTGLVGFARTAVFP